MESEVAEAECLSLSDRLPSELNCIYDCQAVAYAGLLCVG